MKSSYWTFDSKQIYCIPKLHRIRLNRTQHKKKRGNYL